MSVYHCGVDGPVFLDDGRVVTSAVPFQLEVTTQHDQALVDGGFIVKLDNPPADVQPPPSTPTDTQADTSAPSSPSTTSSKTKKGA